MSIVKCMIAFLFLFSTGCVFTHNGICASKEAKTINKKGKHLSKEDVEVIKNLDILEILDFLEEDPGLLKDLDIIAKKIDKGEGYE